MKLGIFGFIVLALFLGYRFLYVPKQNPTVPTPQLIELSPTIENTQSSRYVDYSKTVFDAARTKKRIYYFHAPWCPVCVPLDKEFRANAEQIPNDVLLFKTDYDSAGPLKTKYAVTYQHTFVLVDENENQIKKWNGGGLAEVIENSK